jgi:hypothetical protein
MKANGNHADLLEAPQRIRSDSSATENCAGEGPPEMGRETERAHSASSLIDSERYLPNCHVSPEINTRAYERQEWAPGSLYSDRYNDRFIPVTGEQSC